MDQDHIEAHEEVKKLKKELYDLRNAVYFSRDDPGGGGEIDRLIGDWYPGKEDNAGKN